MSDLWNRMDDWALVLPPSRPAAWQLVRIAELAAGIDRTHPVGVLGSTPEFRDLLFELGFTDVRVFERNVDFYLRMAALRVHSNPETLVHGDWLTTLGEQHGGLSLLLSDLTSGNVPYDRRREFYTGIADSLATGGLFVDKILRHEGMLLDLDSLERKYARLPLNLLFANHFSCEVLFCSELLDIDGTVNTSAFYDLLEDRLTLPRARAFARLAQKITPRDGVWYYGRRWNRLAPDYCKGLNLVSREEDERGSPYASRLELRVYRKGPR